jgi:hypothetical protein
VRPRATWLPYALVLLIVATGLAVTMNLLGSAMATQPAPIVATAPGPRAQPTQAADAPVPASVAAVRVANTDGIGAFLRRSPNLNDRLRAWPDNTLLKVVGPDTTAEGIDWKQVEDPAGNRGWIPAQYTRPEPNS